MAASWSSSTLAVQYEYGTGGFFISEDGGQHFKMLCSAAVDAGVRDKAVMHVSPEGIYLGVYDGLWLGDKNGCGWKRVPELMGVWTGALASDPTDPTVTYFASAAGSDKPNGLYKGVSGAWSELGTKEAVFINTLHVVKTSAGKRFYVTAVRSVKTDDPMMPEVPHYLVRVSDDEAMTWTEYEFGPADQFGTKNPLAEMKILAVDPTNPDTLVASVSRSEDVDDLVYSPMQGKPGTWVKIGEAKEIRGAAFDAEGKLYFGDNDQSSPGFFVVDKLGDMPKQLNNAWKVGCIGYDAEGKRMFACHDWEFGTVNVSDGTFSSTLDMRSAEAFVECPGEEAMSMRCQTQLLAAYCGQNHYEYAPVCSVYDSARPWFMPMAGAGGGAAGTAPATAGSAAPVVAGTTAVSAAGVGASSSAAGTVAIPAAGSGAQSIAGTTGTTPGPGSGKKSGCSCMAVGAHHTSLPAGLLASVAALGLAYARRRRR